MVIEKLTDSFGVGIWPHGPYYYFIKIIKDYNRKYWKICKVRDRKSKIVYEKYGTNEDELLWLAQRFCFSSIREIILKTK
jgi:hypothetical protein